MQGADVQEIRKGLDSIGRLENEWKLSTERVYRSKGRIAALKANVDSIHDHRPLPAPHDEPSGHSHDHHITRNLNDIKKLLSESGLPDSVKEKSIKVFSVLAEAEAWTHGTSVDNVLGTLSDDADGHRSTFTKLGPWIVSSTLLELF